MITHAGLRPSAVSRLDAPLHRARVVERDGDREVGDLLRDARAVWQRRVVLAVADLVVFDADRDHHRVVMTVVGAEDLDDRVAAGEAASDPDRVHRRLRARVQKAPAFKAPAPLQLLRHEDAVLGRGGEVGALRDAVAHRADDRRVRVALDHRSEAVVEVPHAVAVDVVDDGSLAGREIDRPRVTGLVAGGDAAAQGPAGALVELRAAPRALVEACGLALDHAAHTLTVELHCRLRCHLAPPVVRAGPTGHAGF